MKKARNLALFGLAVALALGVSRVWDLYRVARLPQPPEVLDASDPLQLRLAGHVRKLAGELGERNDSKPAALAKAREYVRAQLAADEQLYPYGVNLIAVLPKPGAPVLVVGAHYDTAPGTPGADDNASGVAVLIELARELRGKPLRHEVRFVAYGTEEPPNFGTERMGSVFHARALKAERRPVRGMLSLETLGYYNDAPGSQKYPPVLSLFYPSRGDYVGLVADLRSRPLLAALRAGIGASVNVVPAALPAWIGEIALSDHSSYWKEGFQAVMVTDTAFLRNPHYHLPTDKPGTLNYAKMAALVRALAGATAALD